MICTLLSSKPSTKCRLEPMIKQMAKEVSDLQVAYERLCLLPSRRTGSLDFAEVGVNEL